jgi:ATP-dependent DNA ligase
MDEGRTDQLVFFAFDLLFLNGTSTAQLPLIKRKERLQRLFKKEISGLRSLKGMWKRRPAGSTSGARGKS